MRPVFSRPIGSQLISFGSIKHAFVNLRRFLGVPISLVCFVAILLLGTGCKTSAVKSDFLSGKEPLHKGKFMETYWAAPDLAKSNLSRIYLAPIDTSRIKDAPGITVETAAGWLKISVNSISIIANNKDPGGWSVVETPETATAKLDLAITYLTPGSVAGRFWASELGAGHAFVQVEGKLSDATTGKELALFADRRRDSGAIGFEDLGGNAGPRMVKRMLEAISSDFAKELSATAK